MNNKVRLTFVDEMKGLAIVAIVLFHLITPSNVKEVVDHFAGPFLLMFFALSGYFYSPGKMTYLENLKSKMKSLMIPFLKFSGIFWVIGTVYQTFVNKVPFYEALCCLRNFFGGCIWNRVIQDWFSWDYYHLGKRYLFMADLWFLLALMLAFVLFLAIADWALESKIKSIGTMTVLLVVEAVLLQNEVVLPYNLQNTPYYAMILLLGAFIHKAELFGFFEKKYSAKVEYAVGVVALIIGLAWSLQVDTIQNLFRGIFGANQVLSMLGLTGSMIFTVWGLGALLRQLEVDGFSLKPLSYLGEHSLYVYAYHMFFAFFISVFTGILLPSAFGPENMPTTKDHVLGALLIVLSIVLPLVLEGFISKIKSSLSETK